MRTSAAVTTVSGRRLPVLPLLDYLGRMARVHSEAALVPHQLRPRHLVALAILAESGATTQQDLGAALRLDPSNLVGLLNELDTRGLVSRRRSPTDRRRHIVELTEHGHVILDEVRTAVDALEAELLGGLDRDQRATLAELLRQAVGDAIPCSIAAGDLERADC
jgi:DNA-binding MarR family transcriptional regulator